MFITARMMLPPCSPTTEMKLTHFNFASSIPLLPIPMDKHRSDINNNWSYKYKLF